MYKILLEQNPWWSGEPFEEKVGVKRSKYLDQIYTHNTSTMISILTGIRRAGKSVLFYQNIDQLIKGGVPPENILYFNFFFISKDHHHIKILDTIYDSYMENIDPAESQKKYLFLDEIQEIEGFESWVLRFHLKNREKVKIFLTGSSSGLSSSDISSYFTGRNITLKIFPLDFNEFMDFAGLDITKGAEYKVLYAKQDIIKSAFSRFLRTGGFPEVVLDPANMRSILSSFIGDIIYRDIIKPFGIEKTLELERLANYLLSNSANLFSYRKTSRSIGISYETVRKYIAAFEKASLFYRLPPFSLSRLVSVSENASDKIYSADIGFMNFSRVSFTENYGSMAENLVYNYLSEYFKETLGYYRDAGSEIDFIFIYRNKTILLQVTFTDDIDKREEKALLLHQDKFKNPVNLIITKDTYSSRSFDGTSIAYVPLWYFLISGNRLLSGL